MGAVLRLEIAEAGESRRVSSSLAPSANHRAAEGRMLDIAARPPNEMCLLDTAGFATRSADDSREAPRWRGPAGDLPGRFPACWAAPPGPHRYATRNQRGGSYMPRLLVIQDERLGEPPAGPILFDERVLAEHLKDDYAAAQLIERVGWAVADAPRVQSSRP